jgi:hypothetical protein
LKGGQSQRLRNESRIPPIGRISTQLPIFSRMKKFQTGEIISLRPASLALALLLGGGAGFLCSCATDSKPAAQAGPAAESQTAPDQGLFKFSVLLYREPVLVDGWKFDAAQSVNAEGAALNTIATMREGDVDRWLAAWEPAQRPSLSKEERAALLQQWQTLKDGQVYLLGRVVADTKIIIEASVTSPGRPDQILKLGEFSEQKGGKDAHGDTQTVPGAFEDGQLIWLGLPATKKASPAQAGTGLHL